MFPPKGNDGHGGRVELDVGAAGRRARHARAAVGRARAPHAPALRRRLAGTCIDNQSHFVIKNN